MAEAQEESTHVWSHLARSALFLAAMRHFRDAQRAQGRSVLYRKLEAPGHTGTLAGELKAAVRSLRPQKLIMVEPGGWRVGEALRQAARAGGVPLEVRPDRHFLCDWETFAAHAAGRRQLRQEFFYREMRRRHRVLMEGNTPAGGVWNFDAANRENFGRTGPGQVPPPRSFPPDALTREVLALVRRQFAGHPGRLDRFNWPVTPAEAEAALEDFIAHRLPHFGRCQDALWAGEPWLYHSRLSAALNLKLLDPRRLRGPGRDLGLCGERGDPAQVCCRWWAAAMKPLKSGWAASGLLRNSGWNWQAMKKGWSASSISSTSSPWCEVPVMRKPAAS